MAAYAARRPSPSPPSAARHAHRHASHRPSSSRPNGRTHRVAIQPRSSGVTRKEGERVAARAAELGCSVDLVKHIEGIERQISELQAQLFNGNTAAA